MKGFGYDMYINLLNEFLSYAHTTAMQYG